MFARLEYDIAAATAVAAVGTAELDERLASERHRAVAAATGANLNNNLIYKRFSFHRYFSLLHRKNR
jgi:hypothetical protein